MAVSRGNRRLVPGVGMLTQKMMAMVTIMVRMTMLMVVRMMMATLMLMMVVVMMMMMKRQDGVGGRAQHQ